MPKENRRAELRKLRNYLPSSNPFPPKSWRSSSSLDQEVSSSSATSVPSPTLRTSESAASKTSIPPLKTLDIRSPPNVGSEHMVLNDVSTNPAFVEALERHNKQLSKDEIADFTSPTDMLLNARVMNIMHRAGSGTRMFGDRIEVIVKGINRYMGALRTCIQHSPEVSSLAVGGVMCVLQLAIEFVDFFDKLTDMLNNIARHRSYLSVYASQLFQTSTNVQQALIQTYGDLVNFCREARNVFKDSRGRMLRRTSFRVFLRNIWDPFEARFRDIDKSFLANSAIVVAEAQAQEILDAKRHREEEHYREALKAREQAEEKRATVLASLRANDYEETHRQMFAKRHAESGSWIINSDKYLEWILNTHSTLLWCYGNPGVGKTILSSLVIEDLSKRFPVSPETAVVFAYASYKDVESSQNPKWFISTFVLQMSRRCDGLIPDLEVYYNANRKDARDWTFTTLCELFCKILKHFSTLYLVLDALDEVGNRKELMQFLTGLVLREDTHNCVVKVFVTSRREADIESHFSKTPNIQICATKVSADIDVYIRDELDKRIEKKELLIQGVDDLKEKCFGHYHVVPKGCKLNASGQGVKQNLTNAFLWVVYQLDHIYEQSKIWGHQGVEDALNTLPETMDETYARVLVNIYRQKGLASKLARKILLWVTFARVPMRLGQLATAIAIEENCSRLSDLRVMPNKRMMLEITGNLLTVDNTGHVQFFHYSVKEYLLRKDTERPFDLTEEQWTVVQRYRISAEEAHLHIFNSCFHFFKLQGFENHIDSQPKPPRQPTKSIAQRGRPLNPFIIRPDWDRSPVIRQNPTIFDTYSARWWTYHMETFMETCLAIPDAVMCRLEKHLVPGSKVLQKTIEAISDMNEELTGIEFILGGLAFYISSGSLAFLSQLLGFRTTYHLLVKANHQLVCNRPVETITMLDEAYLNLVTWACHIISDISVFKAFVNDPFLPHDLPTVLSVACSIQKRPSVEYLINIGTDMNKPGKNGKPSLLAVAERIIDRADGLEIMKLLVEKGANPNIIDPQYRPVFQHVWKASRKRTDIPLVVFEAISLLLEHGEDPNALTHHGTALAEACISTAKMDYNDFRNVIMYVKFLVSSGADVNLYCPIHGYPLGAAVQAAFNGAAREARKAREAVRMDGGWNVNTVHPEMDSDEDIQEPSTPNSKTTNLDAPTLDASRIQLIELLLSHGADPNIPPSSPEFGTILVATIYNMCTGDLHRDTAFKLISLLLSAGADINALCPRFGSALIIAAASLSKSKHAQEILQHLLDSGADPNLVHPEFGAALAPVAVVAISSLQTNVGALQALLKAGARLNVEGGGGKGRRVEEAVREAADNKVPWCWRAETVLALIKEMERMGIATTMTTDGGNNRNEG